MKKRHGIQSPNPSTTRSTAHSKYKNQHSHQQKRKLNHHEDEEIDEEEAFNSDDERRYGSLFGIKKNKDSTDEEDDDENTNENTEEESDTKDHSNDSEKEEDMDHEEEDDGGQYMLDLLNHLDHPQEDAKTQNKKTFRRKDQTEAILHQATVTKESPFSSIALQSTDLTIDQLMSSIADTKGFGHVKNVMKDMIPIPAPKNEKYMKYLPKKKNHNHLTTTPTPISRVISERASRKVHYAQQVQDVSLWIDTVKTHREAETLDFRPLHRIRMTRDDLVGKFQPTTDFEREIAMVLEQADIQNEKHILEKEEEILWKQIQATQKKQKNADNDHDNDDDDNDDDDLGKNAITLEEYKLRRGQLAKMRALMFYEEAKRHHMNKIKSKKYRKIRKKQKLKAKETEEKEEADHDPDFARELQEREEMERIQERMTLAHKNTSKWAKRILSRGKHVDLETRRALSEQLRIGDDLRKKMNGTYRENSNNDDDDNNSSNLVQDAKNILQDIETDDIGNKTQKNLLKLAFMKRGVEAQRQRALQEARQLLQELEDDERDHDADSDDDKVNADESVTRDEKKSKTSSKLASAKEMKQVLDPGKLVAKSLIFDRGSSMTVSGNIDINLDPTPSDTSAIKMTVGTTPKSAIPKVDACKYDISEINSLPTHQLNDDNKIKKGNDKAIPKQQESLLKEVEAVNKLDENPWIVPIEQQNVVDVTRAEIQQHKGARTKRGGQQRVVDINAAANIVLRDDNDLEQNSSIQNTTSHRNMNNTSAETSERKIATLNQNELVRMAFARPNDSDIEEEFEKEKEEMRDRDDHSKKKKTDNTFVSGWGSWTGEGAPPPNPPKSFPKKLQLPEKKALPKRKRQDDDKKFVIINEKRVKKTSKFQIENIPYPYTSREQYEQAMLGAIGREWNVTGAVKEMTRKDVITRAGKMIKPLTTKAKAKRPPAKF